MIKIDKLDKYFNRGKNSEVHAINNITALLPDSGMVALFGPSGCGKTTLLNVIGGLDRAQSGSVSIDGKKITADSIEERNRDIGYIFQSYNLSKNLTVYENVATSLRLCGVTDASEIDRRVMAALRSVDMEKYRKRLPENLSGGQQQRVAIARAIVKNPKVILADEPTGNLDEQNTVTVMNILKEISNDHLVILVTHEADLVDIYCDRVIELCDGKIKSEYENENTGKYEGRGKNDIYLGDMEKHETCGGGVLIEYFGDKEKMPARLRLISVGNTVYLKAEDGVRIRVVDNSTEFRFHEGKFEHKVADTVEHLAPELKEPVVATRGAGRLYNFFSALAGGYRNNFGKKKFGRRMLTFTLLMLSMIVVIVMGTFGKVFTDIQNVRNNYNSSSVIVKTDFESGNATYDKIMTLADEYGINCVFLAYTVDYDGYSIYNSDVRGSLQPGQFSSFMPGMINIPSNNVFMLPASAANTKEVVLGNAIPEKDREIVISRAVADMILKKISIDSIKKYSDLMYMDYSVNNVRYTIVGVLDEDDNAVYLTDAVFASVKVGTKIGTVEQYGKTDLTPLKDGEVYLFEGTEPTGEDGRKPTVGDKITLYGAEFTVKGSIAPPVNDEDAFNAWLDTSDYYYCKSLDAFTVWWGWDPTSLTSFESYVEYCYGDALESLEAYRKYYGDDKTEQDMLREKESAKKDYENIKLTIEKYYKIELDNAYMAYKDSLYPYFALMTESDMLMLTHTVREKDERSFIVHSENAEKLGSALEEELGKDNVTTVKEQYKHYSSEVGVEVWGYVRTLIIMLAALALFMFFIMRSNLMKDIREVGINRAIGVKRSNIVYRYYIESIIVFVRSVIPGFVAGWVIVTFISGIPLVDLVYYPWYLVLATVVILFAVTTLCGIIPVGMLLHKTPAQIISKYDI